MEKFEIAIKVFKEEWDGSESETLNAKCRYLSLNQNCSNETIKKAFKGILGEEKPFPDFFDTTEVKFSIGQIIEHVKYGYRGVIVAFDAECRASDEWYEHMQCQASGVIREQPWYHVLVDNAEHTTYVAQQNMRSTNNKSAIKHPWINILFNDFKNDHYIRSDVPWESS